jgi:dethiobiotin synthetase
MPFAGYRKLGPIKISPSANPLRLICPSLMATKIVFVTGTDTGVGKTLVTALLLCHLRRRGARALALKPFCSGGRADAELLHELQDGDLTLDEINPFYFPEPVAPLVSARLHKRRIPLDKVIQHIQSIASRVSSSSTPPPATSIIKNSKLKTKNYLLIEGSGGLLVPLGVGYSVRDLISRLDCEVIIVARNQLGTINHTLLTIQALRSPTLRSRSRPPHSKPSSLKVVLMNPSAPDVSSRSNPMILSELIAPIPLLRIPFLGLRACSLQAIRRDVCELRKIFPSILA